MAFVQEALGYERSELEKMAEFVEHQHLKLQHHDLKLILHSREDKLVSKSVEAQKLVNQSKVERQRSLNVHQVLQNSPDEDQNQSQLLKIRHPVFEILHEDILASIGLRRDVIEDLYNQNSSQKTILSLEERLTELKIDLIHHRSTVKQSCRIWNLFLLFSFTKWRDRWTNEGILLADAKFIYSFLKAIQNKELGLSEFEPAFRDVAQGKEEFQLVSTSLSFAKGNGKKYLGALQRHQMSILDAPVYVKIRDHIDIKRWLTNLETGEVQRTEEEFGDRQKTVVITESPLRLKEQQSKEMLQMNCSIQHRNRVMSMAQFFSMNRYDELQRWRISDMHVFRYGSELPTTGIMDMNVVLNGALPDEKLLVKHLNYLICPLFAISFMLYDRFVMNLEKPLDLLSDPREWYNIKLFRSLQSAERSVSNGTMYTQRKELLKKIRTCVNGIVNHLDRKLGAISGKLCGLKGNQVRQVGLRDSSILAKHYDKLHEPDIPAKLSGFASSHDYYIARDNASMEEFCLNNERGSDLFQCFFPFLDNDVVKQGVFSLQNSGDNTPYHVFLTLKYLRLVFFHDIVYLKDSYPTLDVFSSGPLSYFSDLFAKWCNYVKEQEASSEMSRSLNGQDRQPDAWQSNLETKTAQVAVECASNARKLDKIMRLLEEQSKPMNSEQPLNSVPKVCISKQGLPMLTQMRSFKDMTLREVFDEYAYGFNVKGISYLSLKSLKVRRVNDGEQYRDPCLRTIIGKRMCISNYLEEQAVLLRSLEDSFKAGEKLQQTLGKKRLCSLHQFWMHLKKKQKTE